MRCQCKSNFLVPFPGKKAKIEPENEQDMEAQKIDN